METSKDPNMVNNLNREPIANKHHIIRKGNMKVDHV